MRIGMIAQRLLTGCVWFAVSTQAAPWRLDGNYPATTNKAQVTVVTDQGGLILPANLTMVYCEGGTFPYWMSDRFERTIGSFYIGKTEVTHEQWSSVYNWAITNGYLFANVGQRGANKNTNNPESGITQPVTKVSFRDAMVWCNALSDLCGLTAVYEYPLGTKIKDATNATSCDRALINTSVNGFRLPSEPEWECAARWQGTYKGTGLVRPKGSGRYWTAGEKYSGQVDDTIPPESLANAYTTKTMLVGSFAPNMLGCYDMSGNVMEWCFGTRATNSIIRKLRGGCWALREDESFLGVNRGFFPESIGKSTGFRLALSGSSKGTDHIVYGGIPASRNYVAPAHPDNNPKMLIRFSNDSQLDEYLEDPNGYPILSRMLDGWDVGVVQEKFYEDRDPSLWNDLLEKQRIMWNSIQSGMGRYSPRNPSLRYMGFTVDDVNEKFIEEEQLADDGYPVRMQWWFREDVKLNPLLKPDGTIDLEAYPTGHAPPYYGVDPRFLSQKDVTTIRNRLASSTLANKEEYGLYLLSSRNTMLSLLNPGRLTELGAVSPWWPNGVGPTPELTQEILAYIRANYDGIGEEFHLQDENKSEPWTWLGVESIAESARWALSNGLESLVFVGGGTPVIDDGIGPTQDCFERIFKEMEMRNVDPSDERITYVRQASWQDIQHVTTPENIDPDGGSMTIVSAISWLATRLQQNVKFDLADAVIANGIATISKPAEIQGHSCTVTLTLSGYGTGMGDVALLKGTGATEGGLTVGNNAIDIGEGINVDVVVSNDGGALASAHYKVASFTLSGAENLKRDFSLTSAKGTGSGAQGIVYDAQTNVRSGSGIWVDANMGRQTLRTNNDVAWNRVGSGGADCGLESITLMFYTAEYDYVSYYPLTVNSGTGSGWYAQGAPVQIKANAVPGMALDYWTGSTQYLSSTTSSPATVTMPAAPVSLTANYTSAAIYTLTASVAGGNGSVTPATTNVAQDLDAEFVITADMGYRIASVSTNGVPVADLVFDNLSTNLFYTWYHVQSNGELVVTFMPQDTSIMVMKKDSVALLGSGANRIDLTREGPVDWAVWVNSTSVSPLYSKNNGTSIGDLFATAAGGAVYNANESVANSYRWTDGASPYPSATDLNPTEPRLTSSSNSLHNLTGTGSKISFSVAGSTTLQRLTVWGSAWRCGARITASIGDSNVVTFLSRSSVELNEIWKYGLTFRTDGPDDMLTLLVEPYDSLMTGVGQERLGIGAVALATVPTHTSQGTPYDWLDAYFSNLVETNDYEAVDTGDTDGDGYTGRQEYLTGTDPTDSGSYFRFTTVAPSSEGLVLSWVSTPTAQYRISTNQNLADPEWGVAASNMAGQAGSTSYTTTVETVDMFYKIEVD